MATVLTRTRLSRFSQMPPKSFPARLGSRSTHAPRRARLNLGGIRERAEGGEVHRVRGDPDLLPEPPDAAADEADFAGAGPGVLGRHEEGGDRGERDPRELPHQP